LIQDLSLRSIETGFGGFKTRLKFIKFGHRLQNYMDLEFVSFLQLPSTFQSIPDISDSYQD